MRRLHVLHRRLETSEVGMQLGITTSALCLHMWRERVAICSTRTLTGTTSCFIEPKFWHFECDESITNDRWLVERVACLRKEIEHGQRSSTISCPLNKHPCTVPKQSKMVHASCEETPHLRWLSPSVASGRLLPQGASFLADCARGRR